MKTECIIFDLDGTLWDPIDTVSTTWGITLKKHPELNVKITSKDIHEYMGLSMDKIMLKLFPMLDENERIKLLAEACEDEVKYIYEHGGCKLFPGLEQTLKELSKNYRLFIVSNCQDGYIQCFLKAHNLGKYFKDFQCWETTKLCKGENNKLIMKRNHIKSAVYVGDTQGDAESARVAGIPFIYASYGFGVVEKYDYKIERIEELLNIF